MSLETIITIRLLVEELEKNVNAPDGYHRDNFNILIFKITKLLGELKSSELYKIEERAEKYATECANKTIEAIKDTLS
jgi:phage gp46-like protein